MKNENGLRCEQSEEKNRVVKQHVEITERLTYFQFMSVYLHRSSLQPLEIYFSQFKPQHTELPSLHINFECLLFSRAFLLIFE